MIGHRRTLPLFSLLLAFALSATTTACGDRPTELATTADSASAAPEPGIELDVPFVPTPHEIVARMLEMGAVGRIDHLIDLGSGDGRIVIAAVRDRGARSAEGIDLDPQRVAEAEENAVAAGVADRTRFEQGDLFDKDFSAATVLTLYLTPEINLRLRPRILETLPPGSRVVSHVFDMGAWVPDQQAAIGSVNIYAWTIPARIEGAWELVRTGQPSGTLELEQSFQMVGGKATLEGQEVPIFRGRVDGHRVSFQSAVGTITGNIDDDRMTLTFDDGTIWQASRKSERSEGATTPR
jgi:SAM-dependent methyltransferase